MTYCSYCGTELGTGGCPKWDCPSKVRTVTLGNAPQPNNPPAGTPNATDALCAAVTRELFKPKAERDNATALTALQNKDTNTHAVESEPSVGGGAK